MSSIDAGVALRFLALTAGISAAAATLAAPIRADMMGNAFLAALTNAGVSYSQPAGTMALGQSVCPMLFQPGGSFDSIVVQNHRQQLDCRRCQRARSPHRDSDVLPGGAGTALAQQLTRIRLPVAYS